MSEIKVIIPHQLVFKPLPFNTNKKMEQSIAYQLGADIHFRKKWEILKTIDLKDILVADSGE